MLPGPVLVMLRILAWLLPPHLALAGAGLFIFSNRDVYFCCTLALISAVSALSLHTHDRMDDRLAKGLAAQKQAEAHIAQAVGTLMDSGLVKVAPIPSPAESPDLRLVHRAGAS